eukprot:6486933-Lingulodinium_polyedra.AAC.1
MSQTKVKHPLSLRFPEFVELALEDDLVECSGVQKAGRRRAPSSHRPAVPPSMAGEEEASPAGGIPAFSRGRWN